MKLSKITSQVSDLDVDFGNEVLKVKYKPHTFTANMVDEMAAAETDSSKQTVALFQMVAGTIVDWDLEGEDGKIIPIDNAERLKDEVPISIFGEIFRQIGEAQNPKAQGTTRRS